MRRRIMGYACRLLKASTVLVLLVSTAAAQGSKPLKKCAKDAVVSGTVCMDKYEASIWRVPESLTTNKAVVKKIQSGEATAADLAAAGATHLGQVGSHDNYAPCADNGQNCANDIYAVSLVGVPPSSTMTWFQAQAACKNSRKRLPTNAEWQAGVLGTPDPGPDNGTSDCNTASAQVAVVTGSRSACMSADGAFDMVGNVSEWVADWVPRSTACASWTLFTSPTGDDQCLVGAAGVGNPLLGEPGALARGGDFDDGARAGPFAVVGQYMVGSKGGTIGFRCAR